VDCLDVLQQVGQDLDEVRLARAEEARYPDAHAGGQHRIVGAVRRSQVGVEEAAEVFGELLGDDVFVQLLPDAFRVLWSALITPLIGRLMGLEKSS
jgi:hypothetical protein